MKNAEATAMKNTAEAASTPALRPLARNASRTVTATLKVEITIHGEDTEAAAKALAEAILHNYRLPLLVTANIPPAIRDLAHRIHVSEVTATKAAVQTWA